MTTESITKFVSPQTLLSLLVPVVMVLGGAWIEDRITDMIKTAMQEVTSDQFALLENQLEILAKCKETP